MLNIQFKSHLFLFNPTSSKDFVAIIAALFICNSSLLAQDFFELNKPLDIQNQPVELNTPSKQKSLRDDQYSVGFIPGKTNSSKLHSIFSYSVFSTFKFQKKNGHYGFWISGSVDRSFLKTSERFLSYNPTSDTSYIMHWDIALYAFHFGWDWTMVNKEKAKLHFRTALNAGRFIHRHRTVRTYDYSQGGILISETFNKIEPPIGDLNLGVLFGFGFEYYLTPKQSISFAPTLYVRGGGYYGMDFSTFGLNIAYHIGLSKNER